MAHHRNTIRRPPFEIQHGIPTKLAPSVGVSALTGTDNFTWDACYAGTCPIRFAGSRFLAVSSGVHTGQNPQCQNRGDSTNGCPVGSLYPQKVPSQSEPPTRMKPCEPNPFIDRLKLQPRKSECWGKPPGTSGQDWNPGPRNWLAFASLQTQPKKGAPQKGKHVPKNGQSFRASGTTNLFLPKDMDLQPHLRVLRWTRNQLPRAAEWAHPKSRQRGSHALFLLEGHRRAQSASLRKKEETKRRNLLPGQLRSASGATFFLGCPQIPRQKVDF